MTLRYSASWRRNRLNAILSGIEGIDFDLGSLKIYTGSQPASADDAASGTLLASITLPADAFASASSGSAAKSGTWQDTAADATGTAGWFRLESVDTLGSVTAKIDGSITATSGGGDMEFDDVTFEAGQGVTITTFTLTEPSSSGSVKYSSKWREIRLNAALNNTIASHFGGAAAVLEIRTGSPPASADDAETGTLLASVTTGNPPFAVYSSGSAAKNGTWQDTSADAAGTMGWFRLKLASDPGGSSTNHPRVDGTITATGGGGVLTFDDITPAIGQIVTITTFTFTEPAS